jgi:hypothetical protein
MGRCGLDSSGSGYGLVAGYSEDDTEAPGFHTRRGIS